MNNEQQEKEEYKLDQQIREEKRYENGEITLAEYQRRLKEIAKPNR